MNFCNRCETWKERDSFYTRLEKEVRCKKCVSELRKEAYKANPQKHRDRANLYRTRNPEKVKDSKLKQSFGLAPGSYDVMLRSQQGACKICKAPPKDGKRLHVDHCHKAGDIRALLCSPCNTSLGLLQENIEIMKEMIRYVKSFRSKR